MLIAQYLALGLLAYAVGSIPIGMFLSRSKGVEITKQGSGRIGATNILRTMGLHAAVLVALADISKGVIAVLLVWWLGILFGWRGDVAEHALILPAVAVVVGHNWSFIMRLVNGKWGGGRGVAPSGGVILMLCPIAGVVGIVVLFGVANEQ